MLGDWTFFPDEAEMSPRIGPLVPFTGPLSHARDRRPASGTPVLQAGPLSRIRDRRPTNGTAVLLQGPRSYQRDCCPKWGTTYISGLSRSHKCFTVEHNLHNPHGSLEILQSILSYKVGEQLDG